MANNQDSNWVWSAKRREWVFYDYTQHRYVGQSEIGQTSPVVHQSSPSNMSERIAGSSNRPSSSGPSELRYKRNVWSESSRRAPSPTHSQSTLMTEYDGGNPDITVEPKNEVAIWAQGVAEYSSVIDANYIRNLSADAFEILKQRVEDETHKRGLPAIADRLQTNVHYSQTPPIDKKDWSSTAETDQPDQVEIMTKIRKVDAGLPGLYSIGWKTGLCEGLLKQLSKPYIKIQLDDAASEDRLLKWEAEHRRFKLCRADIEEALAMNGNDESKDIGDSQLRVISENLQDLIENMEEALAIMKGERQPYEAETEPEVDSLELGAILEAAESEVPSEMTERLRASRNIVEDIFREAKLYKRAAQGPISVVDNTSTEPTIWGSTLNAPEATKQATSKEAAYAIPGKQTKSLDQATVPHLWTKQTPYHIPRNAYQSQEDYDEYLHSNTQQQKRSTLPVPRAYTESANRYQQNAKIPATGGTYPYSLVTSSERASFGGERPQPSRSTTLQDASVRSWNEGGAKQDIRAYRRGESTYRITDPDISSSGFSPIMKEPSLSVDEEGLFSRFRIRNLPKAFFVVGRVFMVLWVEPAGGSSTTVSAPDSSRGRLGEVAYTKVRRFVVIREQDTYCSALPIVTYGRKGVGKIGVNKSEHGIIYTGKTPPGPLEAEQPERNAKGMQEIAIRVCTDEPMDKLDPISRLDYGKVHTIQHNIKVKSFGLVHPGSMDTLLRQFREVWARNLWDK